MASNWFWILGWVFVVFGVVGNTWVIFIIAKRRRLQTTANWFILSLAVADLGVTCGYFPALVVCNVLVHSCNDDVRYKAAKFIVDASVFAMIAMILERYVAIVHSLKYVQIMTTRRTVIIITSSWGIPFVVNVFRLINQLHKSPALEHLIISIIYTLLFEVAPIIILVASNLHILLIARKLSLQMKALVTQVRFNVTANSATIMKVPKVGLKASTVRMVTALVATFVTYYGILIHIRICDVFEVCVVSADEGVAVSFLLMANSLLNPLVYAFLKEDIKKETKALFCRGRRIKTPARRLFQVHPE